MRGTNDNIKEITLRNVVAGDKFTLGRVDHDVKVTLAYDADTATMGARIKNALETDLGFGGTIVVTFENTRAFPTFKLAPNAQSKRLGWRQRQSQCSYAYPGSC